jgi:Cu-processing system permease protein
LAWLTIREAVRQKLAVNLLVFAVALVTSSYMISTLTFGEQYRIITDIGLTAMEVFGTLIAVFLGAGLISRDVERRTVYPILAKPVSRAAYVTGRYAGLVATTTLNLVVMATCFVAVLAFYLRGFAFVVETPLAATLVATAIQFAMIAAVAVFFSAFSTATLSAIFTLSLVVAGHLASDLVRQWRGAGARRDRQAAVPRRPEPRGAQPQGGDGVQGRHPARRARAGAPLRSPVRGGGRRAVRRRLLAPRSPVNAGLPAPPLRCSLVVGTAPHAVDSRQRPAPT